MKSILLVILAISAVVPLRADPAKGVVDHGYILPKSSFHEVLEIVAKIANKQVVATSEDDLMIRTSLVLTGPVSHENARKVINALLMLEGFELVEMGQELHLQRVLTKEQCEALNKALERPRPADDRRPPRQRVSGRAEQGPKQWVIVRPDNKSQSGR